MKSFLENRCRSARIAQSKLSKETLDLIADRVELVKNGKRDTAEYRRKTKIINKEMKNDLRQYNVKMASRWRSQKTET